MKALNKKSNFLSFLAAISAISMLAFTGCEDSRMHNMVGDSIYMLKKGLVQEKIKLWKTSSIELPVIKSGVGQAGAEVRLKIDGKLLEDYNSANGTQYKVLPENCYTLSGDVMDFGADDYSKSVILNLDVDAVRVLNQSGDDYVLPCSLETISGGDKVKVNSEPAYIAPVFLDAYSQFTSPSGSILITATDEAVVNLAIEAERIYPSENDVVLTIQVDESLVAQYNADNGTEYKVLPQEVYEGKNQFEITLTSLSGKETYLLGLHKSGFSEAGKYLLPLKITKVSENSINPRKSVMFVEVTFSLDMVNPLARWAEFNVGDINQFATGDPKTDPGSYFQFGRNITFPAFGNLPIITGATNPQDPKTWSSSMLFLEPLSTTNNGKWNWYSEPMEELNTWKKIASYTGLAADAPATYVGVNGGDPSPEGWHIPTLAESLSLVAWRISFTSAITAGDVTEKGIDVMGDGKTADYTAEYKNAGATKVLGIRFKGTRYESAFEYSINEYNTEGAYICIKAKNIYNGETMDDILAWTDAEWEDAVIRYLPVTGYRLYFTSRAAQTNSNRGKEVYFWVDNILSNADPAIRKASQFGFVGWNASNQAFANGASAARDMAVPCRPIKNY